MLHTHCTITGYKLLSADAFSSFKGVRLSPSKHPIFYWTDQKLLDFLKSNFVGKQYQIERVLLIHAILNTFDLVDYKVPMFLDDTTKDNSSYINKAFTHVVAAFKKMYELKHSTNKSDEALLHNLPRHRVSRDNCTSVGEFVSYCERLSNKVVYVYGSRRNSEYDLGEDTLAFKLAIMGLETNSLEENDKLPKKFTREVAEWAAYQYCLYTGAEVDSKEYDSVVTQLTSKVNETLNIKSLSTLRRVLGDVLPMPSDMQLDKAKTMLTLRHVDSMITEHTKLMNTLLDVDTQEELITEGGVTWTVVKTKTTTASSDNVKPVTAVKTQDAQQKTKLQLLMMRSKLLNKG